MDDRWMLGGARRWAIAAIALTGCATAHHVTAEGALTAHTFRSSYNNVHVLVAGDRALVVDAGLERDADTLWRSIEDAGIAGRSIEAIVVTHGHADHAGGADALRRRTDAVVVAGDGDRELLATGRNDRLCPTDDRARGDLAEHQASTYRGFAADRWVTTRTSLRAMTGIDAEVVPLPGHTEGSLVVIAGSWAFVGDLFRGAIFGSSAETHFYMCDLDDNLADIEWLLSAYPNVDTFFTGHFGPVRRESVTDLVARRRAARPDDRP